MQNFLSVARGSLQNTDVQEALKVLSKYGLGAYIPHFHPEAGGIEPLSSSKIQLEEHLKISFVESDDPRLTDTDDIGWIWDEESKSVVAKAKCVTEYCYDNKL